MTRTRIIVVFVCLIGASLSSWSRAIEPPPAATPANPAPLPSPSQPPAQVGPTTSEGTLRQAGEPPPPVQGSTGFDFGSYGRVGVGMDLRGHSGYGTNVVSHGSRLENAPYIEPDFYYTRNIGG